LVHLLMASLRLSKGFINSPSQLRRLCRSDVFATQLLPTRISFRPSTVPVGKAALSTVPGSGVGNPEASEGLPNSATDSPNREPVVSVNGNGNGYGNGFGELQADWSRSYHGLATHPFSSEVAEVLQAPIDPLDIEMKPDGLLYLPEIKYRRILNKAFGPGAWGLAPRGETNVGPKIVSREYALVCQGRLVAIARGEQEYFDPSGVSTATEGCKSNALMRCCKDLGIASELWDPRFIRGFKAAHCTEVFVEHLPTKKKKKLWRRKDQPKFGYPYQE